MPDHEGKDYDGGFEMIGCMTAIVVLLAVLVMVFYAIYRLQGG